MEQAAVDFLLRVNQKFLDFYISKDKAVKEASDYLVAILEKVNEKYPGENSDKTKNWELPFGENAAKNLEQKLNGQTISMKPFIDKIKNENWSISPFTFWSVFFSHNNAHGNKQRSEVLSCLLEALPHLENQEYDYKEKSIVDSLIKLREAKARQLSKQKRGKEENNLTIEGWTQLVDKLSEFAQICWELFKEVMADNPNKDTINGYIQDIKTKKKNGENENLGCDGVGKEAVPNILPFIRPDLYFDFDNNGNITGFTKTEEMNMKEIIELLEGSKQIILTGAPGTGKTCLATEVAEKMIKNARTAEADKEKLTEEEKELFKKVQFHPGYDYSDFIIGLKPKVAPDGKTVTFEWKDGVFKKFAKKAYDEYKRAGNEAKPFIFIIDEINRADLSRVFGEVFSLLEEDYRCHKKDKGITLPNGKDFILSPNLYIIGTMNDIDRSVESMDFALRRRFSWKEVTAEESAHIIDAKDKEGKEKIEKLEHREALKRAMTELNKYIGGEELEIEKDKPKVSMNLGNEYKLGGAYFLNFAKYQKESNPFDSLWNNHIAIIINEYLRGHRFRSEIVKTLKGKYEAALKGQNEAENPDATTAVPPTQEQSDGVQQ